MSFQISPIAGPGEPNQFAIAERRRAESIDELDPAYLPLLDGPVTVTLASHDARGRIQLTPMWFRVHPDRRHVEINTAKGRAKDRHLRANPDVTIQATNPANPYHWVTIYGKVVEVIEETDPAKGHLATEGIDAASKLYIDTEPYPMRAEGEVRVLFLIAPTQIVTFGAP